jgi:hypothetical protein
LPPAKYLRIPAFRGTHVNSQKELFMRRLPIVSTFATLFCLCLSILIAPAAKAQATEKTLHEFTGADGAFPVGNLVLDASGNLYGVTSAGGQHSAACDPDNPYSGNCGSIFKLSKGSSGQWLRTVLYEFTGGPDGGNPFGGLVLDAAGNLYGTTAFGGNGFGVVFKLARSSTGTWNQTVLYTFQGSTDAATPDGALVFDSAGNLYGTSINGGSGNCGFGIACGTVFELSPDTSGGWAETVIYNFNGLTDGIYANSLTFDARGNLYGTTLYGGDYSGTCGYPYYGCGTIFKLSQNSGTWSKTTLYTFTGSLDGAFPNGGVIFDSKGVIYGTAAGGGDPYYGCANDQISGCGVIFTVFPRSSGFWQENVIHVFEPNGNRIGYGGGLPTASLVFDAAGNLYGATSAGGQLIGGGTGDGVVFKLTHNSQRLWNETTLFTFWQTRGTSPSSVLTPDGAGNFYGTTNTGGNISACGTGGSNGCGVVYQITP